MCEGVCVRGCVHRCCSKYIAESQYGTGMAGMELGWLVWNWGGWYGTGTALVWNWGRYGPVPKMDDFWMIFSLYAIIIQFWMILVHLSLYSSLVPGLPRFFLFFGLRSIWKRGRPGNTCHVNDVWWTRGGGRGGSAQLQIRVQ